MKGTPGWVVIVASAVMAFGLCGGTFGESEEVTLPSEEEIQAANEIAAEVEEEKALKEQERKIVAKKHSDAADEALQQGNYEAAIEELKLAAAGDPDNDTYKEKLQAARLRQIMDRLSNKKFTEARDLCDQFLNDYPGDAQATRLRDQAVLELEKPTVAEEEKVEEPAVAVGPPPTAEELLAEAEDYILKKDYQMALEKLLEARELNPYDIKINKRIKQVEEQLTRYERAYYQALREELLREIYAAWTRRPRRKVRPEEIVIQPIVEPSPYRDEIRRKLDTIIPEVNFEDARLKEVVDYLSRQAEVNIVIDPVVWTGFAPQQPGLGPGLETAPGFGPSTTPGPMSTPGTLPGAEGTTIGPTGELFGPGVTEPGVTPTPTVGPPYTDVTTGPGGWVPALRDTGITIRLKNIPLKAVLTYVLRYKNLKFIVEDFAIVIVPVDWVPPESLETEIFRLSTSGIGTTEGLVPPMGGPGDFETGTGMPRRPSLLGPSREPGADTLFGPEGEGGATQTIKDYLATSGVPWPRGSNVIFNSRTGTLIVTNTPTNMVLIRELVRLWDVPALQVEIEARFVELLHTRWFENSFEIGMLSPLVFTKTARGGPVPPGVRPRYEVDVHPERGTRFFPQLLPTEFPTLDADQIFSLRGIMTEPDFQFLWRAIDQRDISNLLSAPRLTTISGQNAQIEVVQEITYPTEYDTETISIGGGWGGTVDVGGLSGEIFMVTPGNWETRDVGIILNVTPSVSADGKMITLILMPEVTDLIKWHNYGNEIYPIQQPVFETRNVTTTVHVNDGETIVLGGLITDKTTTYEDKVPFLGSIPFIGRFFRSTAETSSKANLVIFVTARLITSRGTELAEERALTEQQRKFYETLRESKEEIGEMAPGVGTTGIIE